MNSFFLLAFNLLGTEIGSLAYHIILAFTILSALQVALNNGSQSRRTIAGLGVLAVLQLALFALSGLAWQGLINSATVLPPVDRLVSLMGLLVLTWLWVFPRPAYRVDSAAVLVLLLALTSGVLGTLWWVGQSEGVTFNGSQIDRIAQATSLGIALLGALVLLLRRPPAWGVGLSQLVLLALGHGVQLFWPFTGGDYSGPVRLAEMAAFPLLFILAQRRMRQEPASALPPSTSELPGRADDQAAEAQRLFVAQAAQVTSGSPVSGLAQVAGRLLSADICLVLEPAPSGNALHIIGGYDLSKNRPIPEVASLLDEHGFPGLVSALLSGQSVVLPTPGETPQGKRLAQDLGAGRLGDLAAAPFITSSGFVLALAALRPQQAGGWSPSDPTAIQAIVGPLAYFLHHNHQAQVSLDKASEAARSFEAQAQQARSETAAFQQKLADLQRSAEQEHNQLLSLAAMLSAQEAEHDQYARLQVEHESLKAALAETSPAQADELERVQGELRVALEEIAFLRSSQDGPPSSPEENRIDENAFVRQIEKMSTTAQELRQPLASVIGYTDFLLADSAGVLSSMQRKFLERMKVSTERMERQLEDLILLASADFHATPARPQAADINKILAEVAAGLQELFRSRKITLQQEGAGNLPSLQADEGAIRKVISALVENAAFATPEGGKVFLFARLESSEGKQDYILVQVIDQGGGIPAEELPNLFRPRPALKSGAKMELSAVKALVELLGGRIWADSESGRGARFNLLFPVDQAAQKDQPARAGRL